jgi:4-aminobutyrate aminotransferase-like enzyme
LAPVVWNRAEGFQVFDASGNCWIDFTSGIYVANQGHAHPAVRKAIAAELDRSLIHSYLFANAARARLVAKLVDISPPRLNKAMLLSTGSESIECAIKLTRLHGLNISPKKSVIVSFEGCNHGRTMAAQMLVSSPEGKKWITSLDPDIVHLPFPGGRPGTDLFKQDLEDLRMRGIDPHRIAGFVMESYHAGNGPLFFPESYVQSLRSWTSDHSALLVFDEIQSGFGRTGKYFGFEHYGVEPDLVCCGKAISSSLPLSVVLGRGDVLDLPDPGQMTSTHTGNPICCAAAYAALEVMEQEDLVAAAAEKGVVLERRLKQTEERFAGRVGRILGRGLMYSFTLFDESGNPDADLAKRATDASIAKGVMLLYTYPTGQIKIIPPLSIPAEALLEGLDAIEQAIEECLR